MKLAAIVLALALVPSVVGKPLPAYDKPYVAAPIVTEDVTFCRTDLPNPAGGACFALPDDATQVAIEIDDAFSPLIGATYVFAHQVCYNDLGCFSWRVATGSFCNGVRIGIPEAANVLLVLVQPTPSIECAPQVSYATAGTIHLTF